MHTFNAPVDVPTFFEVENGLDVTMHIHGGGIARIDDTFTVLPRTLNPTPTLDGDSALIESVEAKLENGEYGVDITKNGDVLTLNLSGTDNMTNVNSGILYILGKYGVSKYNEGKPTGDRISIGEVIADNGNTLNMYAVFGTLNGLYFDSGAAEFIVLNDANEPLLSSHDFGISSSTTTKFLAQLEVLNGDTYKIDDNNYVTVTTDGTVSVVLNKSDTNLAWIKRDWVELSKHTFTALSPIYEPIVIKTFTDTPPLVLNKYTPISDYLEIKDNEIVHKKSLVDPATDQASVENPYHFRLINDFDKTFPYGVEGLHILRDVRATQLVLNYTPTVPDTTTECNATIFYENAGTSSGTNADGSTHYQAYTIQNVGGNFESFEIHLNNTSGSYNPAGAILHDRFSTTGPGNMQNFYLVKANGTKREITAYVNSKSGTTWFMNRGLPDEELTNGEHITFVKTAGTTETTKHLIYVSMQVAYGSTETVAVGYITPLLQDSLTITSGGDIIDSLDEIRTTGNETSDTVKIIDTTVDVIENFTEETKFQVRNIDNIVTRTDDASTETVINNIEIATSDSIPTIITRRFMAVINIPENAQDVTYVARIQQSTFSENIGTGHVHLRMYPITTTDFDPDQSYDPGNISIGSIVRESDRYDVEHLPKLIDDDGLFQIQGKFSVVGLSGWHTVGIELDIVDGNTTAKLQSFGINPIVHPDAIGGLFYTTNNGTNVYSHGNPYEIKLSYTTDVTANDVLNETEKISTVPR